MQVGHLTELPLFLAFEVTAAQAGTRLLSCQLEKCSHHWPCWMNLSHSYSNLPQRPRLDNPPTGLLILPLFPSFILLAGLIDTEQPGQFHRIASPPLLSTRRLCMFSSLNSCSYQYCFSCQYTVTPLSAVWEKPGMLEINVGTSLMFLDPPCGNIGLLLMFPWLSYLTLHWIIYLFFWYIWR